MQRFTRFAKAYFLPVWKQIPSLEVIEETIDAMKRIDKLEDERRSG
jgi:hypothetical protein